MTKLRNNKKMFIGLGALSAVAVVTTVVSTSCSNSTSTNSQATGGESSTVTSAFTRQVNNIVKEIKISPKSQYANLYANEENWPAEKLTREFFDGFPNTKERSKEMLMAITRVVSYNSRRGEIKIEIVFQDPTKVDQYTTRTIAITGFEPEPGLSIMKRLYSQNNVVISPKFNGEAEESIAISQNWTKDKITDKYFDGLPKSASGVEPKLADVICNDSDLGQLQLKYNFFYEGKQISTQTYNVSGFANEDFYSKIERLYGDLEIEAREGAKKFSAIGTVWTYDKVKNKGNSWFRNLPQSLENINVELKEVITDSDLETDGIIKLVYTFSKDGFSIDKTFDIDGFYIDKDVAASNLYVASKQFANLTMKKDVDASKIKLKDVVDKKPEVINQLFDLPNIALVSYDYDVLSWRSWKEGEEKLPAGSFKLRFNLTDKANNTTKQVVTKLFYGFDDPLGQWNNQFIYNKAYTNLVANNSQISWREFYTGKGKGGSWDYSYGDVLPATGQQNSVWIPIVVPDIPDSALNKNGIDREIYNQQKVELDDEFVMNAEFRKNKNYLFDDFYRLQLYFENRPYVFSELDTAIKTYGSLEKIPSHVWDNFYDYMNSVYHYNPLDDPDFLFYKKYPHNSELKEFLNDLKRLDIDWADMVENTKYTVYYDRKYPDGTAELAEQRITSFDSVFKQITDKLDQRQSDILVAKYALTLLAGSVIESILPFEIYLMPIMESKSYLPVLADVTGEYRYTKLTLLEDAKYAFGYVNPDKSRFDKMVTYDLQDTKNQSILWDDIYTTKNNSSVENQNMKQFKGATLSLVNYIFANNSDQFRKKLKFDSIKYVSYEGTEEDFLKVANGFQTGMGHTDAYWFKSKFIFEVSYEGETIRIPFTMRLGAFDGLEIDSEMVIGDDSDLTSPWAYKVWKGDK